MPYQSLVHRLIAPLVLVAVLFGGFAQAQSNNPALVASIAYLNLLDPTLLPGVEASLGAQATDSVIVRVAFETLVVRNILDPAVATGMLDAISSGTLPATLLAVFILDLSSGTAPLAGVLADIGIGTGGPINLSQVLDSATAQGSTFLDSVSSALPPGLSLPPVSADGSISIDNITSTVDEILSNPDALDGIRGGYEDAISPLAP